MIEERLQLLSDELNTKFTFTVDDSGDMVDLNILEEKDGISLPKFALLVDKDSEDEKYILSVIESPYTVYFGSEIGETLKVFVSNDIEEIFNQMKKEVMENG